MAEYQKTEQRTNCLELSRLTLLRHLFLREVALFLQTFLDVTDN